MSALSAERKDTGLMSAESKVAETAEEAVAVEWTEETLGIEADTTVIEEGKVGE